MEDRNRLGRICPMMPNRIILGFILCTLLGDFVAAARFFSIALVAAILGTCGSVRMGLRFL